MRGAVAASVKQDACESVCRNDSAGIDASINETRIKNSKPP